MNIEQNLMKDEVRRVKEKLVREIMYYMTDECDVPLRWKGTKTQLVELVSYVCEMELMKSEYDVPLSMSQLSRKVFCRFRLSVPKSLSKYMENIRNNKGMRSPKLLTVIMFEERKGIRSVGLARFIEKVDTYKDTAIDT